MTTLPATSRSLVRPPHRRERLIEALLFLAAALGVVTTIGIVVVLLYQTVEFFRARQHRRVPDRHGLVGIDRAVQMGDPPARRAGPSSWP